MGRALVRAQMSAARRGFKGETRRARQTNTRPTLWETGEFVAIDGEGFSEGEEIIHHVGAAKTRYSRRAHFYAYLAASDGASVYAPVRLGLFQCLRFLCDVVVRNPRAILVAFGASYDVCNMVCHHLNGDEIRRLIGQGSGRREMVTVQDDEHVYRLEYRARKCLTIQRWRIGEKRFTRDKNGNRVLTPHLTARLWDVWGFFQDSFVGVLEKWLPGDPDYQFIKRMKGERSIFERSEMPAIRDYNAAELRCLAKVMARVRDAINDLGLKIARWDGAGAIAAAMLQFHKVKAHKRELPPDVFEAARRAYSGGHIEACKIGYHAGAVHHYDINSAYPAIFCELPSLAHGEWVSGDDGDPPAGHTMVRVSWAFPEGLPFYPLFYRCDDGSIIYPARGSGWYWWAEYRAAVQFGAEHGGQTLRVEGWHHFRTTGDLVERPFSWVEDYYRRRQRYIGAAKSGGFTSGPEKIIKLGLNSLYGKTAQQIGARLDKNGELRLPPFFQLDWAGAVTAGCRAKMMVAAMQKPAAIIAFATDGLFSTEPLDLYCPVEKELGAWEYQLHDGMTIVMPGVYWLHKAGEKPRHYSRGFDKREMSDAEFIHAAWRERRERVDISLTRMVGLGSATISKEFWAMRGCFAVSRRWLVLDGDNSKRYPINIARARPHKGLVNTVARDHTLSNILGVEPPMSAPYPIAWLDGDAFERDLLEGEMADELEARDAELA